VLADSEATRHDLIEIYGTPDSKIHVLYSGVHDTFYPVEDKERLQAVRDRYEIGTHPYIFSVGTVQPRKNYDRLVEAFHQLNEPDVKLVIAGGKGWLDESLYRRIADLDLQKRVVFLGFTPDEDLPALYSAARLFAFPSLYEGFGLPPLEAMACGVPVVASNRSSLPEVIGNAGLLVNPYDVEELAHALSRGLHDDTLRNSLINRGQLRVQSFTWRLAARKLLAHYSELAN
jgi:glycosyltransferase involved in cell wall biosynthesis